jgi:P27 family predicted phage terminase small subunit
MTKGPPRKSSRLRLVEGTDRRGRAGRLDQSREPVAPDRPLVPPYDLSPRVQVIWDDAVADLVAMKIAAACDANQLAVYSETVALFERTSEELRSAHLTYPGSRGTEVTNKLVAVQRNAATLMLRYAQEFGLTPASRTRVETQIPAGGGGSNPFAGGDDFFAG